MTESTWFVAALASAYCGLAALSMAMDRHYADLYGRGSEPAPATQRRLRVAGWLALGLSLWMCAAGNGWPIGMLCWVGVLTCSALMLAFLLAYRPRIAASLAWLAGGVGLLCTISLRIG